MTGEPNTRLENLDMLVVIQAWGEVSSVVHREV